MVDKENEPTNAPDTSGKKVDPVSKEPSKEPVATTPLIDVANAVAERIEKANVETARLLKEQVDLEARKALGGEGGGAAEIKPAPEETPKEYNDRIEKEIADGKHVD